MSAMFALVNTVTEHFFTSTIIGGNLPLKYSLGCARATSYIWFTPYHESVTSARKRFFIPAVVMQQNNAAGWLSLAGQILNISKVSAKSRTARSFVSSASISRCLNPCCGGNLLRNRNINILVYKAAPKFLLSCKFAKHASFVLCTMRRRQYTPP